MLRRPCFLSLTMLCTLGSQAQGDAHLYSPGTNLERSELAQLETAPAPSTSPCTASPIESSPKSS